MDRVLEIPKTLTAKGDLVIIPRKEYEELSRLQEIAHSFKSFTPTTKIKNEIKQARVDYKRGQYLTLNELKTKLGIKSKR